MKLLLRFLFLAITLAFNCLFVFGQTNKYDRKMLYFENFDASGPSLVNLNGAGGPSPGGGSFNSWYINKVYKGGNGVPDVAPQTQTSQGQVNAPNGNYLHVTSLRLFNDSIKNANFDPDRASDAFTELGEFCTIDMDKIEISFFWTGDGDDNAAAELYVSIEGAAWKPMTSNDGRTKLKKSDSWKYELYESDELANKTSVRIGFRWRNGAGQAQPRISFGADDVFVVGLRDRGKKPTEIFLANPSSLKICKGGGSLSFNLIHSVPICEGNYEVQLSNQAGSFNTYTVLRIGNRSSTIQLQEMFAPIRIVVGVPCGITPGDKYKIRVIRRSKYQPEYMESTELGTFTIENCLNTLNPLTLITATQSDTLQPSVCAGSYFIFLFLSNFCFKADNEYWLELSDENGNFEDANGKFLGQVLSKTPDPDAHPGPPGSFSPKMPYKDIHGTTADGRDTIINWRPTPGCKYRLRVRATAPFVADTNSKFYPQLVSAPWGPLCVKDCSIETSETEPIKVCIDPDKGKVLKIPFTAFRFSKDMKYKNLNKFEWELFDYQKSTSVPVHRGKFGSWNFPEDSIIFKGYEPNDFNYGDTIIIPPADTIVFPPDSLTLTIPILDSLMAWGSPPGTYFIRIVATGAVLNGGTGQFTDFQGTLVPITIGVPFKEAPKLTWLNSNELFCSREDFVAYFNLTKFVAAKKSSYAWYFFFLDSALTKEEIDTLKNLINTRQMGGGFVMPPGQNPFPNGQSGWIVPAASVPNAQFFYFFVAEQSGGDTCRSPVSDPVVVQVTLYPPTTIQGIPSSPCAGKQIKLKVQFNPNTYYKWIVDPAAEKDTNNIANNELWLRFPKPGRYPLKLETINKCGNVDTPFFMRVFPQPTLEPTANYFGCKNDKVTIDARMDSSSFEFDPSSGLWTVKYEWVDESGNVIKSGAYTRDFGQTLSIERDVTKTEKITLRLASTFQVANPVDEFDPAEQAEPCVESKEITVTLLEVAGEAKNAYTVCVGNSTTLQASGGDTYLWDAHPTLSNLNISDPIAKPTETTTYKVKILKAFPELGGRLCEIEKDVTVTVLKGIDDTTDVVYCDGQRVSLDAKLQNVQYQWYDVTRDRTLGKARTQAVNLEGTYKVTITNPDKENACTFDQYYFASAIKSKTEEQTVNDCQGKKFKIKAPDCVRCKYKWNLPTLDTTQEVSVAEEGTYTVTVTALDEEGKDFCKSTINYIVELGPECLKLRYNLEIPNAFSPNKDDGKINEKWVVWTNTMQSYKAMVFDRWGHKVFQAEHKLEDMPREVNPLDGMAYPCISWDGQFNGKPVTEGAYIYVIEAVTVTDRKLSFTGNITLIR